MSQSGRIVPFGIIAINSFQINNAKYQNNLINIRNVTRIQILIYKQVFKQKRDSELHAFYSHNDITQVKTIVYFINSKKYK